MQYAIGKDDKTAPTEGWSTSIPTGTDAGTYYVWYKAVGDADHADSDPKCVEVTIEDDLKDMPQWNPEDISYGDVIAFKTELYRTAYERFIDKEFTDKLSTDEELMADYNKFINESDWLKDYALFMAGKDYHKGAPWYMWDESLKNPKDSERAEWEEKLSKEIGYYEFLQYLFYTEWTKLKEYANQKGISIIGDIPIFVAWDSVDVWRNQKLFMLDSKGYPTDVAGVPPDYFSATGQLWGNPLYNWEEHKKTGYEWWIKRIRHQLELTDFLRIDHFRGFDKFWAVPYGDETAVKGRWIEAPGENFFTMLEANLGYHMPINWVGTNMHMRHPRIN